MDDCLENAYETGMEDGTISTLNGVIKWYREEVIQYIPEEKHEVILKNLYKRISEDK